MKHPPPCPQKRVAIVSQCFPHYKQAVLSELGKSPKHAFVCYGSKAARRDSGIKLCGSVENIEFVETRNYYMPIGKTPYAGFKKVVLWQSMILRLSIRRDIDAIIFEGDPHFITTWIGAMVARLGGKRVLFWTIGWLRDEQGFMDRVRRTYFRIPHGLLLYGNYARELAIARNFAPEKLYVVYNSLDYAKQQAIRSAVCDDSIQRTRAELFATPDAPILICCSRLQEHRKLDWLLEAVAILKDRGICCNVLLVGDGTARASLEQLASSLKLEVLFYGACYDESVLARLTMSSDITVAPGMVGLTAMQSLAYGTPVITHNDFDRQSPEFEALVPGESGAFFECGNSNDLARAIQEWIATDRSRESIRDACLMRIEQFYHPQVQCRIIEEALEGRPATPAPWNRDAYRAFS